jgi:hypothetical protein
VIKTAKKSGAQRFTAWSPSRLDDYLRCPYLAKLKHLDKLCTVCFKGKIMGGFDTPAVCDACGATIEKAEALARGTAIGDALDAHLLGNAKTPPKEIRNQLVLDVIKKCRAEVKKRAGAVQVNVALTRSWKLFTGPGWSSEIWLRAKLDYRRLVKTAAHVIDWKTGGIDKKTGEVKASEKYDDQLGLYNVVTLATLPAIEEVTSELVFLDCGPRFDPRVARPGLKRADLPKAQQHFEKKTLAMMSDETFAPKPNGGCSWCDYCKGKGGPCRF